MKTVLLWDPRFPKRPPLRLTLADALASACVRAGVAAAADPAEQGLLAGAALDASNLTAVVVEHGYDKQLARIVLPLAAAAIGAAAGLVAGIDAAIAALPDNALLSENGTPLLAENDPSLLPE